ncbi:MAG TPA: DNA polymerase III subunit delta [Bryobacteraceae bacterium]|nr:DNA polymerase III subunit delta [Bryobacteraceae bacterium]
MLPAQLLAQIKQGKCPPVLLLLGPEAYDRRRLKEALAANFSEGSLVEHDLTETALGEAIDDARALSLFAAERLIWVLNAEAALPKGKSATSEDAEEDGEADSGGAHSGGDAAPLAAYVKDPTPGVTLVVEAARFDFEGDDKRKQERVRKFYAAIPTVVELRRYALHEARAEAGNLLRRAGLKLDAPALDLLVEALGGDMARIAVEIEKLALFAGNRMVGAAEIAALVPDARTVTIFALVNALGRRDRVRSLEALDTLVKEGEYLPLVLSFLSTQFRMALVAREAGLRGAGQIQTHFVRMGVPMWPSRAEQILQTVSQFSQRQLESAVKLLFRADSGLRDARPDDRTIMEQFVVELTR